MKIALVDNGSLEAAAQFSLRAAAEAIGRRAGVPVSPVSWRHSDRLAPAQLGGVPAWTLAPWLRAQAAAREDYFLIVPYFISPQGAIGSSLRAEIEVLAREAGFSFHFAAGLGEGEAAGGPSLAGIAAEQAADAIRAAGLSRAAVAVVDHGGPVRASAELRDRAAAGVRGRLAGVALSVSAASMESPDGPEFAFNRPLLKDLLGSQGFDRGDVVIAPLFLSPGRHAGPGGDLERIARAAEARHAGLRCHLAGLIGAHPLAAEILGRNLQAALETIPSSA